MLLTFFSNRIYCGLIFDRLMVLLHMHLGFWVTIFLIAVISSFSTTQPLVHVVSIYVKHFVVNI